MKKKYPIYFIILFIIIIFVLIKFYFLNRNLKLQINVTNTAYQELRTQKINNNYSEVRMTKLSSIEETFSWLHSENADKITLENYDGNIIDLKEDDVPLNDIILRGLFPDNTVVGIDSIINVHLRNNSRFYYILRYYIKDIVYEILIYDDGTIEYEDTYYDSPILLSAAQALITIINEDQNEIQIDAIDVMLNSYIATCAEYIVSDEDKPNYQRLSELWDNAVRLRASAYFIKKNMTLTENIEKNMDNMLFLKSSGYSGGEQVDMYIYTKEDTIGYVKLVYNSIEKTYILKNPIINEKLKCSPLVNIWTSS